jgi:5-methylcytosine-specific restriction endonuclease McrA
MSKIHYNQFIFSKRNKILKDSNYESYQDFLKSNTWIKIKQIFEEKRKTNPFWQSCHNCGKKEGLQLHHMRYKKSNLLHATLNNIVPLCGVCHKLLHQISRKLNKSFWASLRYIKKYNIKTI